MREKMKYKKIMLILITAIFLASIAGVCAADANDTLVASENTNQMDLSSNNEITEDNLKTSEENTTLTQANDDESDSQILSASQGIYYDLIDEIGDGGDKNLAKSYYRYTGGNTIEIKNSGVINGNGAVIDMAGSNIRAFYVTASGVTIKDLTIKNAHSNDGMAGAIYFSSSGTVENCNFINNSASMYGGAMYGGSAVNCNFEGNSVTSSRGCGGAMYNGSAVNCIFTGNTAGYGAGAMYRGSAVNCNFVDNSASIIGGAMLFGSAVNCNFVGNSAKVHGGAMYEGYKMNCIGQNDYYDTRNLVLRWDANDFTTRYGSAEKLPIQLMNQNYDLIDFINYDVVIYKDGINVKTYHCLSNEKVSLDLAVGIYTAELTVTYPGINQPEPKNITITVHDVAFTYLNKTINGNTDDTINLDCDYTFNSNIDSAFTGGIVINRPVTINGNGHTIDAQGKARVFYVQADDVTIKNLTIKNAKYEGYGGAVYFNEVGTVSNCNFTNNIASDGGAVFFYRGGTVTNCNFTGNTATGDSSYGGAVYFLDTGDVTNCNFTNNTATRGGGAVYFSGNSDVTNCNFADNTATHEGGAIRMYSGSVENCNFVNNSATGEGSRGGAIRMYSATVSNCNFTGNNATTGSAIYFFKWDSSDTLTVSDSTFLNNRANAGALDIVKTENNITITFTGRNNLLNAIYSRNDAEVTFNNVKYWGANGIATVSATMAGSNKAAGQKITVGVVVNNELVLSDVMVTDDNGMIVLPIIAGENYYISARHDTDSYYTEAEKTIPNNTKFSVNVTSQTIHNKTVNITAKSNIYSEFMPGKLLFILPNSTKICANCTNGIWWAVHTFDDYGEYEVSATYLGLDNVTITNATISIKIDSDINVTDIVLYYGDCVNVTVSTEGTIGVTAKIWDKNATVMGNTIMIPVLDTGTYVLTVTTIPDASHNSITKNAMIIVNKCKTELTADAITTTYNTDDDLVITLKDSKGTPLSNQVLLVDLNGVKMFMTDLNGQVKVSTKGLPSDTYAARIVFNGDDNFFKSNAATTVTISKDSTNLMAGAVTATYNANKDLVVTLTDSRGNPVKGADVTVDLNGVKTFTTNANGQIKVATANLAPKTYTAKITFNGNANYLKSAKNVKVTVKKATPKLAAKAKTFKKSVKTKKYAITLKDNRNKVMKNTKVTIKVNKKTYTAKTNAKGVATFKITKLTKKGKYTATVTFKGNAYYNKVTKKVKITIK